MPLRYLTLFSSNGLSVRQNEQHSYRSRFPGYAPRHIYSLTAILCSTFPFKSRKNRGWKSSAHTVLLLFIVRMEYQKHPSGTSASRKREIFFDIYSTLVAEVRERGGGLKPPPKKKLPSMISGKRTTRLNKC